MNWHDCKVYGMGFDNENYNLFFDIDYITDWVTPEGNEKYFKFWVTPCTMVFHNVYNLEIDLSITDSFEICKVFREDPSEPRILYTS